jgi:hypothetical protein
MKLVIPLGLVLIALNLQGQITPESFFHKLEGSWMQKDSLIEQWKCSKEGWSIESYQKGKLVERISVRKNQNGIYQYCPIVIGQNDNKEVCFELKILNKKEVLFANKDHDYPKFIKYQYKSKDKIQVVISLDEKGKQKPMKFNFRKV